MKRFVLLALVLLFGSSLSAASYAYSPATNLQKLVHQSTSTVEDTYTFTPVSGGNNTYVQLIATTAAVWIHSTSGQSQTDGFPIPVGVPFTFKVEGPSTRIYLSAQAGTGTVDFIVLHN